MSRADIKKYFLLFGLIVFVFFIILEYISLSEYSKEVVAYQKMVFPPRDMDMVVVLTGSSGRIRPAYELMKEMNAPVLFVAGTHAKVSFQELAREHNMDINYKDRIVVDNSSKTTYENAEAVLKYAEEHQVNKILLVTSVYHMKRSLLVFKNVFENTDVEVIPYGTTVKHIKKDSWLKDWKVFQNIVYESFKYQYYRILFAGTII